MGRCVVKGCRNTKMKMHYVHKSIRCEITRKVIVIFSEGVNDEINYNYSCDD